MVFLSTLQVLVGGSRPRSVFVFGFRQLTQRIIIEELIMGFFLILPLSLVAAQLTIRLAAVGWRPSVMRSDIWTTILITISGDIFLELLLPSLQCLPLHNTDDSLFLGPYFGHDMHSGGVNGYWLWLQQTWGFSCPASLDRQYLLSPDAVGTLLTVRLIFMCLGAYLGESFIPIALTGGIACGKTTVAQLLVDPRLAAAPASRLHTHSPETSSTAATLKRRNKKPKSTLTNQQVEASLSRTGRGYNLFGTGFGTNNNSIEDDEGIFFMIDTDSIGHEILLPPAILAEGTGIIPVDNSNNNAGSSNNNTVDKISKAFTVHPNESVYPYILAAFGDPTVDHQNILDDSNTGFIDRRKLGAIVFQDPDKRRILNKITHPRILIVMLKRILYGIFVANQDIVCVDVPLLFEKGQLRWLFGLTIVVACSPSLQLQRLRARNPDLTEQQCKDRIASQLPIEEKIARADICIMNNGDMDALAAEVERVRQDVMGRIYGIGMSLLQMLLLVGGSLSLAVSSKLFSLWS